MIDKALHRIDRTWRKASRLYSCDVCTDPIEKGTVHAVTTTHLGGHHGVVGWKVLSIRRAHAECIDPDDEEEFKGLVRAHRGGTPARLPVSE